MSRDFTAAATLKFKDVVIPQRSGYVVSVETGHVVVRQIGHDGGEIVTLSPHDARAVANAMVAAARWLDGLPA